ncbi:MAG: class I tRNA ligase family protein, partial [Bacteroidales bacterium]|nr:class I tRNA ligase family protein [Bacteroidales bacterium]
FFWVARMIMAGNEFRNDIPFHNVYLTGIVRDKLGRKMSKTLGNSPDPLVLIEKYGADAVRIGMLLCSSAGNDILYDESQIEQGRNFCGKIWNAWRLISGWDIDEKAEQPEVARAAVKWFDNLLSKSIVTVEDHYSKFRISDALMTIYKLFRDDFCSWYLEMVKPAYGRPCDPYTFAASVEFFDKLLRLIHPVMPFITEELWQAMEQRRNGETIMFQRTPVAGPYDDAFLAAFDVMREAVVNVRGVRAQKGLPPKEELELFVEGKFSKEMVPLLVKAANLSKVEFGACSGSGVSFIVGTVKFTVALSGLIDSGEERKKAEAELEHQRKFLAGVRAKLSNERFVSGAPEAVVAAERKKESDALARIAALEATLESLA